MQESTSKETALSIVLSIRSHDPSAIAKCTTTPRVEAESFREIFCALLELQPVVAAPSSGEITTAINNEDHDTKGSNSKDASTQMEKGTGSTLPLAPGEPIHSSKGPETLRNSRHAKDDTKVDSEPKGLKWSRWADCNQKDAPQRMVTETKPFNPGPTRHTRKARKNPRQAKKVWKEAAPEPPRVQFDWAEFNREVKENNLKTLKDSRWA